MDRFRVHVRGGVAAELVAIIGLPIRQLPNPVVRRGPGRVLLQKPNQVLVGRGDLGQQSQLRPAPQVPPVAIGQALHGLKLPIEIRP